MERPSDAGDAQHEEERRLRGRDGGRATKMRGEDAKMNAADAQGWTALHVACSSGCGGGDADYGDAAAAAAARERLAIVRELLDAGADPTARHSAGFSPLHLACMHGAHEIAKELLKPPTATRPKCGPGLTRHRTAHGLSPLMLALQMAPNSGVAAELTRVATEASSSSSVSSSSSRGDGGGGVCGGGHGSYYASLDAEAKEDARMLKWTAIRAKIKDKVLSIHWFPYECVRVVNADP